MKMKKTGIFVGFFLLGVTVLQAASTSTALGGSWSQASTWINNEMPAAGEPVWIPSGAQVEVDTITAVSGSIRVEGRLFFSRSSSSTLTMSGGSLLVEPGGYLDMGSEVGVGDGPIREPVKAKLILARGAAPGQYGLIVQEVGNSRGKFTARGDDKTPYGYATLAAPAGDNKVFLSNSQVQGWQVGDVIMIGRTNRSSQAESEERTISSISGSNPTQVAWSAGSNLGFAHAAGAVVANLSRNVLVRSSGTVAGGDSAYIHSQVEDAANLVLSQAEFAHLGHNNPIEERGLVAAGLVMSSCAVHHNYTGVLVAFGGTSRVRDSVLALSVRGGLSLSFDGTSSTRRHVISRNVVAEAGNEVVLIGGSHNNVVEDNLIFGSYGGWGMVLDNSSRNVVSGNRIYYAGTQVSANGNCNTFLNNRGQENSMGMQIDGQENLIVGNVVSTGRYDPLRIWGSSSTVIGGSLVAPTVPNGDDPVNSFEVHGGPHRMVDTRLGYDMDGQGFAAGTSEIGFPDGNGQLMLYEVQANMTRFLEATPFTQPGSYLMAMLLNGQLGRTDLWGDYAVNTDTFRLNLADQTHAGMATTPKLMRGTGHSISSPSTGGFTQSQLISVTYNGSQWEVRGSTLSQVETFTAVTGVPVQVFYPAVNAHVTFFFTQGVSPQTDDRLDFALIGNARDNGEQKKLMFQDVAPAGVSTPLNGGQSRLTVGPGGTLSLQGSAAFKSVVDRAGSRPYTLVSSGTVTALQASFSRMDAQGLQLSGTAGVSLSSVTFDQATTGGAYITARDLTSSATFYGMAFNNTGAASPEANVRVTGSDAGLDWAFAPGWSGALAGPQYESDPNRKVRWLDTVTPGPVTGLAAAPGASIGDIRLDWATGGNDGAAGYFSGAWKIFTSSIAADAQAAAPAQAQVTVATSAALGAADFRAYSGLLLDASYYFRLWALDDAGNTSLAAAATAQALHPDPLPPNAVAVASQDQITVAWAAPSFPPAAYLDHYALTVSTGNALGPYSPLDLNISKAVLSYAHSNLQVETSYYYRLATVDAGGRFSAFAVPSATTPDIQPPAVSIISAAPGAVPGELLVSWSAAGDNNGGKDLPANSRFAVQITTSPNTVVWDPANAVILSTGPVPMGQAQGIALPGLTGGQTYSVRLWSADPFLNWSPASNISASPPRENRPSGSFGGFGSAAAVPASQTVSITFDKDMQAASLAGAFTVRRLRNNMGEAVNQLIPGAVTSDLSGRVFTFTPVPALAGNSLYEAVVDTTALDVQGNAPAAPLTARFMTFMRNDEENVWVEDALGVRVQVPAGALPEDGALTALGALPPAAALATRKLMVNTGDPLRAPVAGASLEALSIFGSSLGGAFTRPLTVSFPYADGTDDGVVDGTNVRVRTLQVHWLDETHNLWVPLATDIDTAAHRVSAATPHFTSFAVLGRAETDVQESYAFPSPFTPTPSRPSITFTMLPQTGSIRLYTPSGVLVRELTLDGAGEQEWDVKNASGEPVGSGVYIYEISNGRESKVGKVGVLR
jgi:parallel beta-helix repeat protein